MADRVGYVSVSFCSFLPSSLPFIDLKAEAAFWGPQGWVWDEGRTRKHGAELPRPLYLYSRPENVNQGEADTLDWVWSGHFDLDSPGLFNTWKWVLKASGWESFQGGEGIQQSMFEGSGARKINSLSCVLNWLQLSQYTGYTNLKRLSPVCLS